MSGDLVFYGFAALAVLSGFVVVFARNIVHAGFALMFTLLGVAGLYAVLGADFLAVTQTVVYIGGILVLVLFAVMMTRIPRREARRRGWDHMVPAGIFALGLFALLYKVSMDTAFPVREPGEAVPTAKSIGVAIMTDWIFPFEFASLVLLVAMVGAAIMIRQRPPARAPEAIPETGPSEPAEAAEEVHA